METVKDGERPASRGEEFGQVVRRHREARNMSQERLAADAGLSAGYISLMETGERGKRPSRDVVLRLAQALNTPAAPLLEAAGRLEPGDPIELGRPSFAAFVNGDTLLRSDQKEVLVRLYAVFVGRTAG